MARERDGGDSFALSPADGAEKRVAIGVEYCFSLKKKGEREKEPGYFFFAWRSGKFEKVGGRGS